MGLDLPSGGHLTHGFYTMSKAEVRWRAAVTVEKRVAGAGIGRREGGHPCTPSRERKPRLARRRADAHCGSGHALDDMSMTRRAVRKPSSYLNERKHHPPTLLSTPCRAYASAASHGVCSGRRAGRRPPSRRATAVRPCRRRRCTSSRCRTALTRRQASSTWTGSPSRPVTCAIFTSVPSVSRYICTGAAGERNCRFPCRPRSSSLRSS